MTAVRRFGLVLRDGLAVAGVAVLAFQLLRHGVADRYVVPTGSMEPTLYGDQHRGDVVLVDKLASAAGLQRYDLAVWRSPEDAERRIVKRVIAFGDDPARCRVDLRDGDLWLGRDEQSLAREQKDPLAHRDLRVPWFVWPAGGAAPLAESLAVPAGALAGSRLRLPTCECEADVRAMARQGARAVIGNGAPADSGWLRTARAIDVSYLDADGRRKGAGVLLDDVGADITLATAGVDDLFCGLDLRPDSWLFHWDRRARTAALWRNGETVGQRALPADLAEGATARVEFGYLDGRFFFAVDGRADALLCVDRRPEWQVADLGPLARPGPRTQIHFGARATGTVEILALQVFHDLYWKRELVLVNAAEPYTVQPGHVFLLGDNSFDSHDSRMFKSVGVPLTAFVGRPRLILGPWQRRRWLPR